MRQIFTIASIVWLEMLRRKDLYILLVLLATFLLVLVSLNIFGMAGMLGYVKEIGLLLIWICLWFLTVNLSARQLPREKSEGTIFTVLTKPLTRWQLLLGKWLGVLAGAALASIAFYLLIAGLLAAYGGQFHCLTFCQHILLHTMFLSVLSALGVLFSTRMNHDAAATLTYVASLSAYLLSPLVPELISQAVGIRYNLLLFLYFALPRLDLFDMRLRLAHDWQAAPWNAIVLILLYGIILTFLLLLLAWISYRKRYFSRQETV